MKQKYLLAGAFIVLIVLILITSIFNHLKNLSPIDKKQAPTTKNIQSTENFGNYNPSFSNQSQNKIEISPFFLSPTPVNTSNTRQALKEFTNLLLFNPAINPSSSSSVLATPSVTILPNQKPTNHRSPTTNRQPITDNRQPTTNNDTRAFLHDVFYLLFFPESTTVSNQSSLGNSTITTTPFPTLIINNHQAPTTNHQSLSTNNYIHYPQCDGDFDNYPLPDGCNVCQAGCGPTTIAMILSSFVDKTFTPDKVVDIYKKESLYAGCEGTRVDHAQQVLNENGIQTTDLLYYGDSTRQETIEDFKQYLNSGWTLFTLAKFCQKDCGHFFWIVDIDDKNQVWAYDPAYGRAEIPFNENRYDPLPKYYVAFGVKKL